jgi:xanthine dehydrogenase YagT iron-sulfur-binding subunit
MCGERRVTTIEGLADGEKLHPMQAAFVEFDGLQCGYCTPGQICSAVAMLDEAKRGDVSYVTEDLAARSPKLTKAEIRERMSGNICRCGAYPNIVAAIEEVHAGGAK